MLDLTVHWDLVTIVLYVINSTIGMVCAKKIIINKDEKKLISKYLPYFIWIFTWEILAVARYVSSQIGGADALPYISYYRNSLIDTTNHYAQDYIFKILNQSIRFFTSDYHLYFFVYNFILIISYIFFIKEYCPKDISKIPFFLIGYIFLRGFVTMRTNLAVSFILIGLAFLKKDKKIMAYLFILLSFCCQKASLLYILFIFFYEIFKNKDLKIKEIIIFMIGLTVTYGLLQNFIISKLASFNGVYSSYAKMTSGTSFFNGFWKIAFEQILLAFAMVIFNKDIKSDIANRNDDDKKSLNIIYKLCIFDFITIPITFYLLIWRGYEYFYLPRLIMWGEIIYIINKKFERNSRKVISFLFLLLFVTWFIFRLNSTYEDSKLMPYVCELFVT